MLQRRLTLSLVAAVVATLALAGQAGAAIVTGDTPPQPIDHQLFLRWSLNSAGNCGPAFLSVEDAADEGNSCAKTFLILANTGQLAFVDPFQLSLDPDNDTPDPITIDASKPLTGTIALSSVHPNAIKVDIRVTLGTTVLPVQHIDAGTYTSSWELDAESPSFPFSVAIPASLDKQDVNDVKVEVIWKQVISVPELPTAWVELDDPPSSITIPAYDSSWTVYCQTHTC